MHGRVNHRDLLRLKIYTELERSRKISVLAMVTHIDMEISFMIWLGL